MVGCKDETDEAVAARIEAMPIESIYDGARAAQPDEVWNFGRGDGFEKAVCLATVWKSRHPEWTLELEVQPSRVRMTGGPIPIEWTSAKGLTGTVRL
ncbi:MAG: hypothetical protein U1E27_10970 [Kiritimatiellia bacterium]|nr:hypothetical protein [Kiritimatiellia bacterium]